MIARTASRQPAVNRLSGIEAIRFVSALAVLFWHYQHFSFVGDESVNFVRESQPFYATFSWLYDYGNHGVEVFWCLSGFIFFWKYRHNIEKRLVTGWAFLILRVSRLYPLHFITLIVVAAMQSVYLREVGRYFVYQQNDLAHFLAQLLLVTDWGLTTGYSFNGPIWSVSIEVFLYVAFFALLRSIGGSLRTSLVLVALFAAGHAAHVLPYQLSKGLAFFYLGGVTANLHRLAASDRRIASAGDSLAMVGVIIAIIALALASRGIVPAIHPTAVLMLLCPPLIFLAARHASLTGRAARLADVAGSLTYSSYLLHFPLQLAVALAFSHFTTSIPLYSPLFFLGFFVATLGLSRVIYTHLEMPAQEFIRARLLPTHRVTTLQVTAEHS